MTGKDSSSEAVITVTQIGKTEPISFRCRKGISLMEAMRQQGVYISSVCGGRGTCGKCRLQVTEGSLPVTVSDRRCFTDSELTKGWRLSCSAYPAENCTILLRLPEESDFETVTETSDELYEHNKNQALGRNSSFPEATGADVQEDKDYGIAIDIGTTTVAIGLVCISEGTIRNTFSFVNRQRAFGADVVSRIQASNSGRKDALQDTIRGGLLEGIRCVLEEAGLSGNLIKRVAIACNTTMGHLLLGYSCETLGSYPFTPVNIDTVELPFEEMFHSKLLTAPVVLLPGISAFIGGDIAAGLFACDFHQAQEPCLFIDLGTNSEMAVGNRDKTLATSAAAGPAFEGGNISCGTGSIAGAIRSVSLDHGETEYQTIADKPPVGICGTGIIELVAELLAADFLDETGLFCEEYFETGFPVAKDTNGSLISVTQKDIREIQLAKSAIRTGIEILVREYGITYDRIDRVFLAGGFGFKMNLEKAIRIGLLPKELAGKITAVGNSSLNGAVRYLLEESAPGKLRNIIASTSEIHLSNTELFQQLYLENIDF